MKVANLTPVRLNRGVTSVGDVFALIRELRVTTRAELVARTSLSRTAVTARVAALLELGLVAETERAPSTGDGPPPR